MPEKKPKLGQNFLTDPGACCRIIDALGDISEATVLEIGPGRGALTALLTNRARRLIAVELDPSLAVRLSDVWRHSPRVRVIPADILALDLTTLAREETSAEHPDLFVVGNLPYYITSDILLHLFAHADAIRRSVVMVQEEVADRIAAHPGVRDYGLLSATAQMHARIEKLFAVPSEAFSPPPNVNSAVVHLEMRSRFEELQVERGPFLRFLQVCFRQKRKTLANNLKIYEIATSGIQDALNAMELDLAVRAEAVSITDMAQLYRYLQSIGSGLHEPT